MKFDYIWVKALQNGTGPKLIDLTEKQVIELETEINNSSPKYKMYSFYKGINPPEIDNLFLEKGISSNDESIITDKNGILLYIRLVNKEDDTEERICEGIEKLKIPLLKLEQVESQ